MSAQSDTRGSGRVIFITGAGAGMGRAFARRFATAGDRIALLDVDAESLAQAAAEIEALGVDVCPLQGDVADEQQVVGAFDAVTQRWGQVDVLINNAGVSCNVPTVELSLARWQRTLDINQTGVFLCSRELGRRHGEGQAVVINISSMYGKAAAPERLAYCASKSAVVMMTRVLAVEWADRGIRVNGIAPGYIDTALLQTLSAQGRVDLAGLRARTPQSRLGTAEEMAELVFFLASEQSGFITGEVITSDGGWTAYGYL